MSNLGALNIKITADASEMKSEMKKAGDALKKGSKELRNQVNEWGKWSLAVGAAAVAASTALVQSNLKSIQELRNLAQASNETVASFERGAFAARQYGIDQQKFGDILKDVNDRVGDFLTTGGGPMADFFDTIAPKVGVTAEQFKNLSGSQALQLYVDTLEKANVNQQEMTFFLEAMASDSTLLLPLLKNNGEAMREQAEAAKELGIGLSEIQVENALKAQAAIDKLTGTLESQTMAVVADLAPAIEIIADEFFNVSQQAGDMGDVVIDVARTAAQGFGVMADGLRGIEVIAKALELSFQGVKSTVLLIGSAISEHIISQIELAAKALEGPNSLITAVGGVGSGQAFSEATEGIQAFTESARAGQTELNKLLNEEISQIAVLKDKLHNLALETLPSEGIDEFFNKLETAIADSRKRVREQGENGKIARLKDFLPEPESVAGQESEAPEAIQERMQTETEMILEMLGIRYLSQEELLAQHLNNEIALLEDKKNRGIALTAEEENELANLRKQARAAEKASMIGGGRDIINILAKHSKAALALQKGYAIAQAGVSIATGIARAQELGFPANLAEMARIAGVASEVYSSIKGASKGAASIPTGGATSAPAAAEPVQQQQQGPAGGVIDVNFRGSGFFTPDMMRNEFLPAFNDLIGSNVEIRGT